jgi:hypothetical protein
MNITKALKQKNKLVKEINELSQQIAQNNSYNIERVPIHNSYNDLMLLESKINDLVELKRKIQVANNPIVGKIYKIAELKGLVQRLKYINTKDGRFRVSENVYDEFQASINEVIKEKRIKKYEEEIENLQEEIESFNAITNI